MAKYIQSRGNVISGKYEKGLLYIEKEYKAIGIYKTEVKDISLTAKLSDGGMDNYKDYLNQIRYFSITPNSIISATTLGSFEENNSEAINAAGRWFGTGAALVTSQLLKGKNHIVRVEYKDHTSSTLCIDDYLYQTFIVIASEIVKEEPESPLQVGKEVDNSNNIDANTIESGFSDNKETINSQRSNIQAPYNININPNNPDATIDRIELFIEDGDWESAKAYCNAGLDYFPRDYRLYKLALLINHECCDLESLITNISEEELEENSNFKKAIRFGESSFIAELEAAKKKIEETRAVETKEQEYKTKKTTYEKACNDLKQAKNQSECKRIAGIFESLEGFEDSEEKIQECKERAKGLILNGIEKIISENKERETTIKECENNINLQKNNILTMKQEIEAYIVGLGYDIEAKEKELIAQKKDIIDSIQVCLKDIEQLKKAREEEQDKYSAIKLSLFKSKLKQEYLDKIAALEKELAEKEELYNSIEQKRKNHEKDYRELIITPRNTIMLKKNELKNVEQKVKENESTISRNNTYIKRNNEQIYILKEKIDNNDFFS